VESRELVGVEGVESRESRVEEEKEKEKEKESE